MKTSTKQVRINFPIFSNPTGLQKKMNQTSHKVQYKLLMLQTNDKLSPLSEHVDNIET